MNVTKWIAALMLAALAIPTQGVYGGSINYSGSFDSPTDFRLNVNHPDSTFGSKTFTLQPPLNFWSVNGTLIDHNATGIISDFQDTVSVKNLTIQHRVPTAGPLFSVPDVTVMAPSAAGAVISGTLLAFAQSKNHGSDIDNVVVGGSYRAHTTFLGGGDIDGYNLAVVGDHSGAPAKYALVSTLSGANESTAVATSAFGTLAALYHADTNQLNLEIDILGLQASDISGIQITSSASGFTTWDLGTSALVNGSNSVSLGGDFLVPSSDLGAIASGNAFVNVLTYNNPTGEIGGTLSTVDFTSTPEPSSLFLLASGLAGLAWWRRKVAA